MADTFNIKGITNSETSRRVSYTGFPFFFPQWHTSITPPPELFIVFVFSRHFPPSNTQIKKLSYKWKKHPPQSFISIEASETRNCVNSLSSARDNLVHHKLLISTTRWFIIQIMLNAAHSMCFIILMYIKLLNSLHCYQGY